MAEWTVAFDTLGGSAVVSQAVEDGDTATRPDDPIRGGYDFIHWSLTPDGEPYDFGTPVTGHLGLYAVWEAATAPPDGGMGWSTTRRITEFVEWERHRDGVKDSHGNVGDEWEPAVEVGVWAVDPGGVIEPRLPGQQRVITTPTVYGPPEMVFGPHDRVTARGVTYEVEGGTSPWIHPDRSQFGNVASLRKVSG